MVSADLLDILRCPVDRTRLTVAEPALIDRLNAAIASRSLTNVAGDKVPKRLDGGLVREAGDLLYPIVDQIPVMLPDEAIALKQLQE
ncbi:MAG: Trm112 family protein [Planctomycetota bacterium]